MDDPTETTEPDEPSEEELAHAGLCNAIDDLVTAGRNAARDRNCGTVRKLKRAAITYVLAAAAIADETIPQSTIDLIREYEELDGDD